MLYIPKINDYLEILTNEEVKDFVAINFSEFFKSIEEEKLLETLLNRFIIFLQYLMNCNQILLIIPYITLMLKF